MLLLHNVYAQDKKDLVLSFSVGVFTSPNYKNSHLGDFYKGGGEHFLTKRNSLSFDFLGGRHQYYDNLFSDQNAAGTTHGSDYTNAKATYTIFSISYKHKIINKNKLSVAPALGAGIMTHSNDYSVRIPNNGGFGNETSSLSDLVFPVSLDIQYEIARNFQIGITSGLYIHPDYSILGWHVGPRFSYILK